MASGTCVCRMNDLPNSAFTHETFTLKISTVKTERLSEKQNSRQQQFCVCECLHDWKTSSSEQKYTRTHQLVHICRHHNCNGIRQLMLLWLSLLLIFTKCSHAKFFAFFSASETWYQFNITLAVMVCKIDEKEEKKILCFFSVSDHLFFSIINDREISWTISNERARIANKMNEKLTK